PVRRRSGARLLRSERAPPDALPAVAGGALVAERPETPRRVARLRPGRRRRDRTAIHGGAKGPGVRKRPRRQAGGLPLHVRARLRGGVRVLPRGAWPAADGGRPLLQPRVPAG